MNRKKILIVLYYYHPYVSGLSLYAKRLAEKLASRNYSVTIVTTNFTGDLPKQEVVDGIKIIRCPILFKVSKGVVSPSFLFTTIKLALKNDIVNMHLPMLESGIMSLFISRRKLYTKYHCDINLGAGFLNKVIEKFSYLLMKIALLRSRVVIVSSHDYFSNSKLKKFIDKSVEIIPPIDTSKFIKHKDVSTFRNKFDIKKETFVIGFVGRIVYEKGISYLLESISHLSKEISDFKIIIAGDYSKVAGGSIKNELDEYIKKYPDKIIFTGFLSDEDLLKFYSSINVLVLPSIDPLEAFGMVQVEAMSCGCPVIASNLPGVRKVVQETKFGFISQPKDSLSIADKIISVYKSELKTHSFRKEDWDIEKTVSDYISLFEGGISK